MSAVGGVELAEGFRRRLVSLEERGTSKGTARIKREGGDHYAWMALTVHAG